MSDLNMMLIRRRNLVLLRNYSNAEPIETDRTRAMACTAAKNIESLGYTLGVDVIVKLSGYSEAKLASVVSDLIDTLKHHTGADKQYNPMYPNFPEQVMELSDAELYGNAIIHYITGGQLLPDYQKNERFPLFESVNLKVLNLGSRDDVKDIFVNLCSSKTSLSQQDKDDIALISSLYWGFIGEWLPDDIPLKENVAVIGNLILAHSHGAPNADAIKKYFHTATDVLRLMAAMSGGDLSLAKPFKMAKVSRKMRRTIMDLLADCANTVHFKTFLEDLHRHKNMWIHAIYMIHPGEWQSQKYDLVRCAFDTLRNVSKPLFFAGRVQQAINSGDTLKAAQLLKQRPGEFARKLDDLLRDSTYKDGMSIAKMFAEVAEDVSTPVLWQVRSHFVQRGEYVQRNDKNRVRVVFPKGNTAKAYTLNSDVPSIDYECCNIIVAACDDAIMKQYNNKPDMGRVFIDNGMKNYLMPFSQRSSSATAKMVTRGSRFPINKRYVRGFIWWTNNPDSRVDLDLSCGLLDENFNSVGHVSYTRLRDDESGIYHSGDIVNGGPVDGKGVAEFIDFDTTKIRKDARYVVFTVLSYTRQKFSTLKNVRFGWMERDDAEYGEIFEPSTVEMSMDISADSIVCVPVLFDMKEKSFIWADLSTNSNNFYCCFGGNNIENNMNGIKAACHAIANTKRATMYDVIFANAVARGVVTFDRQYADIIFSADTTKPTEEVVVLRETGKIESVVRQKDIPIITPYNLDYFMALI